MCAVKSLSFLLFCALTIPAFAQKAEPVAVENGVSYQLANYRQKAIDNIQYTLDFTIPAEKSKEIQATEIIAFDLKNNNQLLQLDFKQDAAHIKSISVNGKQANTDLQHEHLLIDKSLLHTGANKISIDFIAGNESLNRNEDYLYALFVPDHARSVFPCFDQPDLKAKFLLTLTVPQGWNVLANGVKKDSLAKGNQVTYHFANSDKLPTYLFSFTAGKYNSVIKAIGNRKAEFLYRETDQAKIKLSVDSVFDIHKNAIDFLQGYTGIGFPFQKVGFVAIPDFQFGGMEHPGEVQYKASSLFLDDGATKDQLISRINLISHETAHMWFGDMVTMRWFNDVWMKEVFANFMADKVTEKLMGSETFKLKFLQDHYPAAYGVDRTTGANPIRQQLDNLQDAGSMYGNIIYHKAPIMMRGLEMLMGKENFRKGVQEYLKKYAYSNATWPDLIAILSKYTKADLYKWNKVWVNQPGRPVFDYKVSYSGDKISKFTLTQHPEFGEERYWPQTFNILLVYPDHSKNIPVSVSDKSLNITKAIGGKKPEYIVFDTEGVGYGLLPLDTIALKNVFKVHNPLQRASTYITAYENMLAGRYIKPDQLIDLLSAGLKAEDNEMNLRLITGYIGSIYWEFLSPAKRKDLIVKLEDLLWDAMQQQAAANNKKVLFKTYQDIYLSNAAKQNIYTIWQKQQAPAGIKLAEDDYTSLAFSIALKSDTVTHVLQQQEERIKNADRKKRIEFLMPALALDQQTRDQFFYSLKARKNREKEAWVGTALYYLNHPLRQKTSVKYVQTSLDMADEIQRTGDIFFPSSWLGASLGSYQSHEVAQMVRDFIKVHPNYNPKLRDKILQAADNVFRAEKLID
ncbi:M1 family metallopeptidase [Mucilaginibacter sp. KACC 22063]|uniref:M1 family metallopeptidase n=1 Tax=Mucilaginibacter sp. KACC 22063 TaxID=3025666 RepID=UPI003FD59E9F